MCVRNFQVVAFVRWSQGQVRLYSRNEDRFALIAHLMTQSTTEFFGEILRIVLHGIRFLIVPKNASCQASQAESMSVAFCIFDQSASSRALFTSCWSARSYDQIVLSRLSVRFDWTSFSLTFRLQMRGMWSDRPTGGSDVISETRRSHDTRRTSSNDPKFPSE